MENYKSLTDALDDLRKKGYDADFSTEAVCLYCGDLDIRLDPDDFHIDDVYLFEKNSSPHDSPVLYAITSSTGVRGTLVSSYDPNACSLSLEMAKKLKEKIQHSTTG